MSATELHQDERAGGLSNDGPRERFVPKIRDEPIREADPGFTSRNTSGLNATELVALDRALGRLMSTEAKRALHVAVAEWLQPSEAAEADLERLLAWR